ncbi:hypothetical protein BC834DRAFT_906711 [Gloeopeniophorella convolvens]|nr:hypothetical protein BC834DRAFT_906711 [Gloeopeniophorella convolvens]
MRREAHAPPCRLLVGRAERRGERGQEGLGGVGGRWGVPDEYPREDRREFDALAPVCVLWFGAKGGRGESVPDALWVLRDLFCCAEPQHVREVPVAVASAVGSHVCRRRRDGEGGDARRGRVLIRGLAAALNTEIIVWRRLSCVWRLGQGRDRDGRAGDPRDGYVATGRWAAGARIDFWIVCPSRIQQRFLRAVQEVNGWYEAQYCAAACSLNALGNGQ